jgi:tetratricopeptide (TPR) repeat protein
MPDPGPGGGPPARASVPALPSDLNAEELRILAYASAVGSEFDFPLLVKAMGANEEELSERLENLVHRGILRERLGGERFGFVEEEFRARTYRSLTESRLRILHRKVAEAMEASAPTPPPELYADLGRHYFLGKVTEKSLEYNRRAAEQAREADDPERALHHYERALVDLQHLAGGHAREEAETIQTIGDLRFSMGDFPGADKQYSRALERAAGSDPGLTARLLLARAEIAREDLDGEGAARGAIDARQLFEMAGDPVGVAQTHRLVARLAFQRGSYLESLDENMRALELLEANRDPRLLGRLAIDLGNSFALLGPDVHPIAIEWYQHAIDRLSKSGDWVELSRAYHNLAVAVGESHPQDGLEYLTRAREAADRAHDARSAGWSLLSGVEMRLSLGQLDEAERDNEQAARGLRSLSDRLGLEQVDLNRGEIGERRGQWEEAERAYLAAIAACRQYELSADESEVQFRLARLRAKTRDWAGAREAYEIADRLGLVEARPNLAPAFRDLRRTIDAGARASETPTVPAETAATDHPPL